jgi:hypothetical protein
MSEYRFKEPSPVPTFGPLPEGDYMATVVECGEPYVNPKSGNYVLAVKLAVGPEAVPVFFNPWAGTTTGGDERDDIARFLVAVNRAPKIGTEPDWKRVVGAKGKCKIKIEIASQGSLAGKPVNRVAFFYAPRQVGPGAEQPRQSFTEAEVKESQAKIAKTIGTKDPDLDVEPDDIPF